MTTWSQFAQAEPELAAQGLAQFREHGPAFLATVRKDGSPQLHPVCPYVFEGGLYVFLVNLSTKYHDLLRDGRYALHALLSNVGAKAPGGCATGDEFLIRGRAAPVTDAAVTEKVKAATGAGRLDFEVLFEFSLEHCLATTWSHSAQGDWPTYRRWKPG